MRKLLLMRHADAQLERLCPTDRERSITVKGMKELDSLRSQLQRHLVSIDFVLCSNARRTRQTLEGIRHSLPLNIKTHYSDHLYHSTASNLLRTIQGINSNFLGVLIIGHNPYLTEFLKRVKFDFPPFCTGSIAILESNSASWFSVNPEDLSLKNYIVP